MYCRNTPSGLSTVPVTVTDFDSKVSHSPDHWSPALRDICKVLFPECPPAGQAISIPALSSTASFKSILPPPSPGSGLEPPPPVECDKPNLSPIYGCDTPSASSAIPIPVTKLDSILDSPEPWPPTWRQICKALFPGPPVRKVLFPPARPFTGSIDSLQSPMSDSGSESSPPTDACQTFAPLLRLTNTPTVQIPSVLPLTEVRNVFASDPRVFYRPDELRPKESFTPASIMKKPANKDQTANCTTFAQVSATISQISDFHMVGLENASTSKDVVSALAEALREVSLQSCEGIDDVPGESSESVVETTKEKPSVPSTNNFSLDAKAFMSYGLLSNPEKQRTVQDDLESLTWIFFYIILRYTKHNAVKESKKPEKPLAPRSPRTPVRTKPRNKPNLHALLTLLFGQNAMAEEEYGTGFAKLALFLTHRPLPQDFEVFDNPPITAAVYSLIELFEEKYRFLERTAPKRIRAMASERDISYEDAEGLYKATDAYKRRMEKIDLIAKRMKAIFDKCLNEVGWPTEDKLVDGLAPTGLD